MKLKSTCPICNKNLELIEEVTLGNEKLNSYKCGHLFSKELLIIDKDILDFNARDLSGKIARDYQKDGIKFIVESNFNAIIGDQQRLGKTPQSLLAYANYKDERTPLLIIVRSANLWQWIREYKIWADPLPNKIYPILTTDSPVIPGFDAYIISMDTFSCPSKCKCGHRFHELKCKSKNCTCRVYQSTNTSVADKLKLIPFRLIIADEAHSFKNTGSNRSQVLTDFVQHLRSESKEACGLILLTGTAIKNRADEYFVPLNLIAPEKFSSLNRFQNQWLAPNDKGQYTRVKNYLLDSFKQEIAPYVLRREKEDVYKDLPPLNRIFTVIQPDKDALSVQYNKLIDELESKVSERYGNPTYWECETILMKMRRICGLMKVMWLADYLEISLMDSDNQRYAIGIHHKDVRDILYHKLGGSDNCLKLSGEDNSYQKDHVMRSFENSQQRILIINMLAGGVGMDFHYCNNVVILERQWSSADEEQFEFRFYNPDKSIKVNSTNIEYIVAKGTIDEKFYDMVESKRKIFGETISNNWNLTSNDDGSFKDLIERTVGSRL